MFLQVNRKICLKQIYILTISSIFSFFFLICKKKRKEETQATRRPTKKLGRLGVAKEPAKGRDKERNKKKIEATAPLLGRRIFKT